MEHVTWIPQIAIVEGKHVFFSQPLHFYFMIGIHLEFLETIDLNIHNQ